MAVDAMSDCFDFVNEFLKIGSSVRMHQYKYLVDPIQEFRILHKLSITTG